METTNNCLKLSIQIPDVMVIDINEPKTPPTKQQCTSPPPIPRIKKNNNQIQPCDVIKFPNLDRLYNTPTNRHPSLLSPCAPRKNSDYKNRTINIIPRKLKYDDYLFQMNNHRNV